MTGPDRLRGQGALAPQAPGGMPDLRGLRLFNGKCMRGSYSAAPGFPWLPPRPGWMAHEDPLPLPPCPRPGRPAWPWAATVSRAKASVTVQAEAGPVCPVLTFTPEPAGAATPVLRAGGHGDHAGRPSGGPPLLVLCRTADVLPALRDARFAMAGVTPSGEVTRFPLTGAELQSPDGGC
jgi:hypothetical protein